MSGGPPGVMPDRPRFAREAWLPVAAGLVWLWTAPSHGVVGFLFSVLPGCLLLGSGVSMLLYPGDRRIAQFAALGGLAGVIVALPAIVAMGWLHALALIGVSLLGFMAAGAHSVALEPCVADVPAPEPSLALSAQVAVDEALLGSMVLTNPYPRRADRHRIMREVAAAHERFADEGFDVEPAKYHAEPPPLSSPSLKDVRVRGVHFEHLFFPSGYEPRTGEPGRDRWLARAANRTAHAWVVRHPGPPRPWLVCIHGYQMGRAWIDLAAFPPPWLHSRLGMNLLLPVLPLHGPRKAGRRSGDGFLTADVLDTVHAEAQAMWDIRRLLGWVRGQGGGPVGVMGYSLGGYTTALLAGLEDGLACAIAGIPASDVTALLLRHAPPLETRDVQAAGLDEARVRELMSVVSPLALAPRLPVERRFLFAGVADRLVPAEQPRDLWRHWDHPRIVWYQGAHVTFRAHPSVVRLIGDALRTSGLAGDGASDRA